MPRLYRIADRRSGLTRAGPLVVCAKGREREKARIGPLHIEVEDKEHLNIPLWIGIAGAVGGAVLLASRVKS